MKKTIILTQSPDEKLMKGLQALFKEYDKAIRSERIKRGIQARKQALIAKNKNAEKGLERQHERW